LAFYLHFIKTTNKRKERAQSYGKGRTAYTMKHKTALQIARETAEAEAREAQRAQNAEKIELYDISADGGKTFSRQWQSESDLKELKRFFPNIVIKSVYAERENKNK
jgi:hypothetical protein